MFKKTKIAAATVALLGAVVAPNASAVSFDEYGDKAQVLIFPYYNTNNGFQTAFNIRNTKNEYKVLKVRFRESGKSNDVLDFNVYMSPYDHFSMTVRKDANGDAVVSTNDKTCTYPAIPSAGQVLNSAVYKSTTQSDTLEGYLEVIEQSIVTDATVKAGILHDATGKPASCGVIKTAWTTGVFTQGGAQAGPNFITNNVAQVAKGFSSKVTPPGPIVAGVTQYYSDNTTVAATGLPLGVSAPTGGLQGYSILLDTVKGAAFVADAIGIANYSTVAQHYKSDDPDFYLLPSLASGSVADSVVMNNTGTGVVTTTWGTVLADWGLSDPNVAPNTAVPSGINPFPIAEVLAATALTNDYFINPAFDGATDWVVTLPMRKHGIYNGFRYTGGSTFTALTTNTDITLTSKFYNREEAQPVFGAGFSPATQGGKKVLTREVNILSFTNTDNATNKVLGSNNPFTFTLEAGFVEGWAELTFTGYALAFDYAPTWVTATAKPAAVPAVPVASKGVPMVGFAAIRGNLGAGSTVNLGETVPHSLTRNR